MLVPKDESRSLLLDNGVILGCLAVRVFAWAASMLATEDDGYQHQRSWLNGPILASALIDRTFTLDHVQEGTAIRQLTDSKRFVDAYQGSQTHLPPLCLASIEAFPHDVLLRFIILVLDVRIARNLFLYARRNILRESIYNTEEERLQTVMDPRIQPILSHVFSTTRSEDDKAIFRWDRIPIYVAQLYFVTASCIALLYPTVFQNFPIFFLTEALVSQSTVWSSFAIALSSYLDVHNLLFLIPITLATEKACWLPILLFVVFAITLQSLSHMLVGGAYLKVVLATHLHGFRVVGMAPSLSIMWYFGMQVFQRFQLYFTFMLGMTPYTIVAPLTIRLYKYPCVLVRLFYNLLGLSTNDAEILDETKVATVWGLSVLFRPPSTLYKLSIGFCFLLMNPRSLARWKPLALVVPFAMTIPISLYLVTYWLWIEVGNGEANFCFFQCIGYNVMVAGLFLHFVGASLRRDKALRHTAKHNLKED